MSGPAVGRSRAILLAAVAAGLIAALSAAKYLGSLDRRDGPVVDVFVLSQRLDRGTTLTAGWVRSNLAVRRVPDQFTSADRLTSTDQLIGARAATDLPAGAFLTTAVLEHPSDASTYRLRKDERAITVEVKTDSAEGSPGPGRTVDVFASGIGGAPATQTVIERAEILATDTDTWASGEQARRQSTMALVTLRVASQQVAQLIRADVFARELRIVSRPSSPRLKR